MAAGVFVEETLLVGAVIGVGGDPAATLEVSDFVF